MKTNINIHDAPIQRTQRQEEPAPDVRRVIINKEDIDRIGMTPGCPGCEAMSRGGNPRGHNEACRTRVEADMKERGHDAFKRAEERMMSRLAEQLEAQDADPAQGNETQGGEDAEMIQEEPQTGKRKAEEDIEEAPHKSQAIE